MESLTWCLLPWFLASSWPASASGYFYVDLEITVHFSVIPWSLSIWPSLGQVWLVLWAPSRTTGPDTQPSLWTPSPTELGLSLPNLLLYPPHTNKLMCVHTRIHNTHPQHTHNTYKTHHTHTHSHPLHALGCNILPYSVSPFAWFWPWNPVWPYCLEGPISRNSSNPRNWVLMQLWPGPATAGHVESWDSSHVWMVETLIQSGSSSLDRDRLQPKLYSPHACHWIQNRYHWGESLQSVPVIFDGAIYYLPHTLTVQTTAFDTCITLEGKCVGSSDSYKLRHAWAPT